MKRSAHQAYAIFCDGNDLKRIDVSAEEHLQNIDAMATALLDLRRAHLADIDGRCGACGGSGRRDAP